MGKWKKDPKYNVISIRVSDEEKSALEEITRLSSKSISVLLREAMQFCNPQLKA